MALVWQKRISNFIKPITKWFIDGFRDEETGDFETVNKTGQQTADTLYKSGETLIKGGEMAYESASTFWKWFIKRERQETNFLPKGTRSDLGARNPLRAILYIFGYFFGILFGITIFGSLMAHRIYLSRPDIK